MTMRKLLVGVVSAGVAASIALGVRNQLTNTAPVEHPADIPAAERVRQPAQEHAGQDSSGTTTDRTDVAETPASRDVAPDARRPAPAPVLNRPDASSATPREQPSRAEERPAAEQEDAAAILRRAAAAYRNVRSMQAEFTQVQDNPIMRRQMTSRGTFSQQQPDKFLMRFSDPADDVVVGDGQYFWVYYPSHDPKQVLRLPASAGQGVDLQSQFIGDPTQRFSYTLQGKEDVGGRSASVLTLVPRSDAGYRSLKVWIDDKDSLVRRFVLTNDNGVVQQFDLTNLRINPALDPAIFRFRPPAGATIVER